VSIRERAAVFLYKLGRGGTHRDVEMQFGIAESTSRKIVHEILEVVIDWATELIKWPEGERKNEVFTNFEARGFPLCIGILDGTHIYTRAAAVDRMNYANRKKRITINNLLIVDLEGYVTYVKAGEFKKATPLSDYYLLLTSLYFIHFNHRKQTMYIEYIS
jgi:hypothetical protein